MSQKEECLGCPHLYETKEKPKIDNKVKYLSVEHHSVCNLRCSYCSQVYYSGKKSNYDVVNFINDLKNQKSFDDCDQVVWGGGEPTLDKSFEQIVNTINAKVNPKIYHRVFTNSVRFSQPLYEFLKKGLIKIVTSIDAGSEETFKKVRGRPRFYEVFENLKKYSSHNSSLVTIKYIFTDENDTSEEIDHFVENCKKYNLKNCNFQISMNFKDQKLELEKLKNISYLFGKLQSNNITKVFLDDHIMFRFQEISLEEKNNLRSFLKKKDIENILINKKDLNNIIIFGAGKICDEILKKIILKQKDINFDIVDSSSLKINKSFHGKKIHSPEFIKNNDRKIFISAAQSYDEIYQKILQLQGGPSNILNGMII